MLSKDTLDHILEAKSHIRAAIKSASVNEKSSVVYQLSKILVDMEQCEKIEELMDMIENRKPGSGGSFGTFFNG
jgi:hypothetical protein